jgi:hypothetical protein
MGSKIEIEQQIRKLLKTSTIKIQETNNCGIILKEISCLYEVLNYMDSEYNTISPKNIREKV